jgi:hypothetical protein
MSQSTVIWWSHNLKPLAQHTVLYPILPAG